MRWTTGIVIAAAVVIGTGPIRAETLPLPPGLISFESDEGEALLIGAELNSEIEHASPYGKDPGEKVAGEKKKIGVAAEKAFEQRRARGETNVAPFPDGVNCDLDAGDRAAEAARYVRPRS